MTDISKLATLLDDPEIRALIFGLAHVDSAFPAAQSGAPRLHAVVLGLAVTTPREQYHSWLSDDVANQPMTADQVRRMLGEGALDDLAQFTSGSAIAVASQLAAILPDFVDAISPGGRVVDATQLAGELGEASADDDRSSGAFGSRVH